jgi:hypothetical protein
MKVRYFHFLRIGAGCSIILALIYSFYWYKLGLFLPTNFPEEPYLIARGNSKIYFLIGEWIT